MYLQSIIFWLPGSSTNLQKEERREKNEEQKAKNKLVMKEDNKYKNK